MKKSRSNRKLPTPDYLPTREQIDAACEEIQKGWSDYTRLKRRYGVTQSTMDDIIWTPPLINHNELLAEESKMLDRDYQENQL